MNQAGDHAQWQQQQTGDTQQQQQFTAGMAGLPDDDFSKYLEVDNIDFGFSVFDDNGIGGGNNDSSQQQQQHVGSQHHQHNLQDLDARTAAGYNLAPSLSHQQRYGNNEEASAQHISPSRTNGLQHKAMSTPISFGAQTPYQHGQAQQQQQNFNMMPQQHFSVPPTPNSAEMYPGAASYIQHFHGQHRHKELMNQYGHQGQHGGDSYTPMISPDVMPGETSLQNVPQYTIPGAYLSPLTSPAINPQGHSHHSYSQSHTAESSLQGSPILGMDFNMSASQSNDASNDTSERPKKTRKRGPTSRTSTATTSAISPAGVSSTTGGSRSRATTGSQKRSRENSLKIQVPPEKSGEDLSGVQLPTAPGSTTSQSASGRSTAPNTREGTRSKSVSPHALPEARMPPPPKPSPAMNSTPTMKGRQTQSNALPPATPASLMRLQQRQVKPGQNAANTPRTDPSSLSPSTGDLGMSFEELKLPDAAAVPISAAPIAPLMPKSLAPQSTSTSAVSSPTASSIRSPTSGSVDGAASTRSNSTVRGSRKRNSTSSNLVSPALRPKISPSIKPLLPERANGISDETHALLLASKSNYQNILEGNHLPGVTYSSELSTNLTSKRTSHKIAEQGRRNRINMAIQEMQSLLPLSALSGTTSSSSDKDCTPSATAADGIDGANGKGKASSPSASTSQNGGSASASAAQGNSKAATVESAIEYIKKLKDGLQERDEQNEALRKELSALREKLGLSDSLAGGNGKDRTHAALAGAGVGSGENDNDNVLLGGTEDGEEEEEEEEDATMSG